MVEHDPHTHVVHVIVAVNDDVPCGYDRMHLWNLIGDSGIASAAPVERLADYLQLSLRCCLPDPVSELLGCYMAELVRGPPPTPQTTIGSAPC